MAKKKKTSEKNPPQLDATTIREVLKRRLYRPAEINPPWAEKKETVEVQQPVVEAVAAIANAPAAAQAKPETPKVQKTRPVVKPAKSSKPQPRKMPAPRKQVRSRLNQTPISIDRIVIDSAKEIRIFQPAASNRLPQDETPLAGIPQLEAALYAMENSSLLFGTSPQPPTAPKARPQASLSNRKKAYAFILPLWIGVAASFVMAVYLLYLFFNDAASLEKAQLQLEKVKKHAAIVRGGMDIGPVNESVLKDELSQMDGDRRTLDEKLKVLSAVSAAHHEEWKPWVSELAKLRPEGLWFEKFSIKNQNLIVRGYALEQSQVLRFVEALNSSGKFKRAGVQSLYPVKPSENSLASFEVYADAVL